MALIKTIIRFPIFAPPPPNQPHHPNHRTPTTVIRFSRWNNANAQKFIRHERTQKEIEDQLRFHKRFDFADKIATIHQNTPTSGDAGGNSPTFKSTGSPSTPSRPSIPGKKSKYSKPLQTPQNPHPAFRRTLRIRQIPTQLEENKEGLVKVGDNGVSYLVPEAPFEFQYSYTETPKAKPLKLREPPIAPFGPSTMPRPWTGRKPLPPSKKKLDFDSFRLPPPNKKGVKPVQAPGPFLPGTGPKYVQSRDEILGEPLRKDEIDALIKSCLKTKRQLNMGRDGLTHNMLDNIHAHWKRRRVCKIKCKGVCTVDMDNVRQQLEEKTGGKIIFSKGGVIFLFRGRNYNYKTRPIFPLMLWKPVTPVYPRLIQRAPEGLTLEEASEMRKKGRELIPICKLGKNGVYCDLVENVREAFEACELVRINCQGMNGSDYHKIGAKLKDLVPCVLISFEHEHILMWRGRDWKSTILEDEPKGVIKTDIDGEASIPQPIEDVDADNRNKHAVLTRQEDTNIPFINDDSLSSSIIEKTDEKKSTIPKLLVKDADNDDIKTYKDMTREEDGNNQFIHDDSHSSSVPINTNELKSTSSAGKSNEVSESGTLHNEDQLESSLYAPLITDAMLDVSENISEATGSSSCPWTEGVLSLLKEAVEGGNAVVLDDSCLDADVVYERAVSLAQTAAPGPVFKHRRKKQMTVITENQEATKSKGGGESEEKEVVIVSENTKSEKKPRVRRKGPNNDYLSVAPKGSLRVDELAKLLA